MTREEKALDLTAELWNLLVEMDKTDPIHVKDLPEHERGIHNIQNRIAARKYFRDKNQKDLNETRRRS